MTTPENRQALALMLMDVVTFGIEDGKLPREAVSIRDGLRRLVHEYVSQDDEEATLAELLDDDWRTTAFYEVGVDKPA